MKINNDESNSVPEKIQLIETKLQSLVSNQTGISESVSNLSDILSSFRDKIDTMGKEESEIKNLEMKLSSIKQDIELLTKISKGNEDEINNITNILASLNITTPQGNISKPNTSQEYEPFHIGRP